MPGVFPSVGIRAIRGLMGALVTCPGRESLNYSPGGKCSWGVGHSGVCTFMCFSCDPQKSFAAFSSLFTSYTSLSKCVDSSPSRRLPSFDWSQQLGTLGVLKTLDNRRVQPSRSPHVYAGLHPHQKHALLPSQAVFFSPTSLSSSKKHIFFYSIHFFKT